MLIHLGVFHVLFGGTLEKAFDPTLAVYTSLSGEWSGMLGEGFNHLDGSWVWNFFDPAIAFVFVMLAFNFMIKGMEDVFLNERYVHQRKKKKEVKKPDKITRPDFEFVRHNKGM